jgi:4'-phosphopantetheinyl transferase EntD
VHGQRADPGDPAGTDARADADAAVIGEVLPATVAGVEAFADPSDPEPFPEEASIVARAVDKRRREFVTARLCARAGLRRLGLPPAPILPGERGAPGWPVGVVGSMTHCAGYRAAAVARATDVATLGIDAEVNDVLPDGVLDMVARPEDHIGLRRLPRTAAPVCWDRLLFSAKESVYKAWFPVARRWLGFEQAVVTIDPVARTFTARLLVADPPPLLGRPLTGFTGRWLARDSLLLTSVVVPARPAATG